MAQPDGGPFASPATPTQAASPLPALLLAEGATLPLLHLWGSFALAGPDPGDGGPQQPQQHHHRQLSWGGSELFRTFSAPPKPLLDIKTWAPPGPTPAAHTPEPGLRLALPASLAAVGSSASASDLLSLLTPAPELREPPSAPLRGAAAATLGGWSSSLSPFCPVERQRIYLQGQGGAAIMVTYRIVLNRGHLHIILFK